MDNLTHSEEEIKQDSRLLMKVPFFQVPNSIFDNENELTEHEIIIYIYLCRCGNQGGSVFPSLPTIGSKTKTSRATAARAIGGLIEKGYIVKHKRTGSSNIYEIIIKGVVPEGHGVVSERDGGVVSEGDPKKNYSFKKKKEKEKERGAHSQDPFLNEKQENQNQEERKETLKAALAYYRDCYELRTDHQPNITGADIKNLTEAIKGTGIKEDVIRGCLDLMFSDKWFMETGFPLKTFAAQLNQFIAKLKTKDNKQAMSDNARQALNLVDKYEQEEAEAARQREAWELLPEAEKEQQREEQRKILNQLKESLQSVGP